MLTIHNARGFALLEAVIASTLVATALAALASLATIAARQTGAMRRSTAAAVLAQAKLEELRALEWRFAEGGARASSSDLNESPASTLSAATEGWVEELDRYADPVIDGQAVHFERRWRIRPLAPDDLDTLVLQVCVFVREGPATSLLADACVQGIRTRKP